MDHTRYSSRAFKAETFRAWVSLNGAASDWHIMARWCEPFKAVVLLSLLAAFSRSSGTGPDLTAEQPFKSRTEIRQQGAVTVRAAVLTDDESERYFNASLADHGIQVIWLSVDTPAIRGFVFCRLSRTLTISRPRKSNGCFTPGGAAVPMLRQHRR